ncbi:hypothetical protein M406DRAFT_72906 [Cryphonectria parasitica EP155]|uniref:Transcription factor TFIIIC triple barrel domain-containing protein n=1 Tax=Cryphonectria parasitica (strain ATCC 38755 / EP155) TaxID=660469 RepID=A0A9P5CMC1_CRYP1|nr:uncharacterized protein M406DRAFT_72906 [Cryphonectria parasitica EP155]KAF3762936.1 hypothetical protein M406DRAFT_72906 [Cryphonectria parasitica EP155]
MVRTAKAPIAWPGTTPETAASFPLAQLSSSSKAGDDQDEWEYEYSNTETERKKADGVHQTYYLTIDMSHSGMFEKVKDSFHAQNRGGYKQWFNPVYADPNKNTKLRPTKTNAMLFGDEENEDEGELAPQDDDEDEEEIEGRDGDVNEDTREGGGGGGSHRVKGEHEGRDAGRDKDDNLIDPTLRNIAQRAPSRAPPGNTQRTPSRAASRAPSVIPHLGRDQPDRPARIKNVGEIQILDLHSDNPIISYKGRIFSGSWAHNIGTELLFGDHDEVVERNLPHLRSLAGGVDLMAACSARILTVPADLRPKNRGDTAAAAAAALAQQNRRPAPDRYKHLRKEAGIEIPIAFDKHGRRKPQARFLENLMAIKRSRGEMDDATTMTRDTTRDWVDRDDDPEEASLQKKRARDRKRQQRLMEERLARPKKKRHGGNRWMRRRVVTFADRGANGSGNGDDRIRGEEVDDREEDESVLSRPTPTTWDELGRGSGEGGGENTGGEVEGHVHGAEEDTVMDSE